MSVHDVKLIHETKNGSLIKSPARLEFADGRIWFRKSPFALKDEIKAMAGSKYHGYDEDNPRKMWSVRDCFRNRFQLKYLMGENVYEWFDRPLVRHEYRPLFRDGKPAQPMPHQFELADAGLTYHYQIWAAEMGVGKTLAAQMVIEHSQVNHWYWVGPKTSLPNIRREFRLWGFDPTTTTVDFMTYERLRREIDEWSLENPVPQGVIFDESSRCKTWSAQRTQAAYDLANLIRERHGLDGFVILMSGTPSPKRPIDWWAQCEICWPGFLREGSVKALESRLAFVVKQQFDSGTFSKPIGWRDDERKCDVCGEHEGADCHQLDDFMEEEPSDYHAFKSSKNEIAYLHKRLKGLVIVKHKKDCLSLPEERYRKVYCPPSPSVQRVAKVLLDSSTNVMTAMTLVRELSDGFQYREVEDGTVACNHCQDGRVEEWYDPEADYKTYQAIDMLDRELVARLKKHAVQCPKCHGTSRMLKYKRIAREVPCPKDKALRDLLDECDETGRIVIFAGFTGSVDRVCRLCHVEGWSVVRCDGRGFQVTNSDSEVQLVDEPLDYWADLEHNQRVAFVAHPESGGMSFTLTEARMAVYWSNSFKPEYRVQSKARVHRKGMDENLGCTIVDLIHLPTDERVLDIIQENRRLELMTLGDVVRGVNWEDAA